MFPNHGAWLRHNPYNGLLIPRPIGWISSIDKAGNVNYAVFVLQRDRLRRPR